MAASQYSTWRCIQAIVFVIFHLYHLQTTFDPDDNEVLKNGTKISLLSWKYNGKLNTHNVAAPMTSNRQEVSGYVKYEKGLKQDTTWELILPDGSEVWYEDVEVMLRHVTTGSYLTVTDKMYPEDWGEGLREVAGSSSKRDLPRSRWRVVLTRPPSGGNRHTVLFITNYYRIMI